jgi:hypothetical protein
MNRRDFLGAVGVGAVGCAGSQVQVGATGGTGPGGQGWQVGVTIGITIARDAMPVARTAVDSSGLAQPVKDHIDQALQLAADAIAGVSTVWTRYLQTQGAGQGSGYCAISGDIDAAVELTLEAFVAMRDAGLNIPAQLPGAIQALGIIGDEMFPACSDAGTSPAPASRLRAAMQTGGHPTVSRRVQHVLGGGSL